MDTLFLSVLAVVVFALTYILLGDVGRELRLAISAVSAFFTVLWAYYITLADFYGEFSFSFFHYIFDDIFVFSTLMIFFSIILFLIRAVIGGRRHFG